MDSGDYMDTSLSTSRWQSVRRSFFGTTATLERSHLYTRYIKILNKSLSKSKALIANMEKKRKKIEKNAEKRMFNLYQIGITGPLLWPFKEACRLETACVDVRIQRECRLCGLLIDQITFSAEHKITKQPCSDAEAKDQSNAPQRSDSEASSETSSDASSENEKHLFFRLPCRLLSDDIIGAELVAKVSVLESKLTEVRAQCSTLKDDYVEDRSIAQRGSQLLNSLVLQLDSKRVVGAEEANEAKGASTNACSSEAKEEDEREEWHQAVFESVIADQRTREGRLLNTFFTQHLATKMKQYKIFGDECLPPPTTLLAFCAYLFQIVAAGYSNELQHEPGVSLLSDKKIERRLRLLISRVVFRRAKPLCELYYTSNVQDRSNDWENIVMRKAKSLQLAELGAKEKFIPKIMQGEDDNPYLPAVLVFFSIFHPARDSPMDATDRMLKYVRILHECAAVVSGGEEPGGLDDLFPLIVWTISREAAVSDSSVYVNIHRGLASLELFIEDVSGESAFYLVAIMSAVEYLMKCFGETYVSEKDGGRGEGGEGGEGGEETSNSERRSSMSSPALMTLRFKRDANQKAIHDLRSFLTDVDMEEDLYDAII